MTAAPPATGPAIRRRQPGRPWGSQRPQRRPVVDAVADGELVALSRVNGNEIWRNASLLRREPTLSVPFNTTVAVGDFEGYIHFFSNIDGEPVASMRDLPRKVAACG